MLQALSTNIVSSLSDDSVHLRSALNRIHILKQWIFEQMRIKRVCLSVNKILQYVFKLDDGMNTLKNNVYDTFNTTSNHTA